jgi:hypothetical protein
MHYNDRKDGGQVQPYVALVLHAVGSYDIVAAAIGERRWDSGEPLRQCVGVEWGSCTVIQRSIVTTPWHRPHYGTVHRST